MFSIDPHVQNWQHVSRNADIPGRIMNEYASNRSVASNTHCRTNTVKTENARHLNILNSKTSDRRPSDPRHSVKFVVCVSICQNNCMRNCFHAFNITHRCMTSLTDFQAAYRCKHSLTEDLNDAVCPVFLIVFHILGQHAYPIPTLMKCFQVSTGTVSLDSGYDVLIGRNRGRYDTRARLKFINITCTRIQYNIKNKHEKSFNSTKIHLRPHLSHHEPEISQTSKEAKEQRPATIHI